MRIPVFFLCFFFSVAARAQLTEKIETDRPDQTETPYTVPKNWLQGELGFSIENETNGTKTFVHPTLLGKYGLTKRFELRLIAEVLSFQTPLVLPQGNDLVTGLQPIQIGGKLALLEQKGLRPKTSLIFHTSIPNAASVEFQQSRWAPNFRFTMQHSLSETISLGYNIGAEWDGEEGDNPAYIYTLAPGFSLGDKWYAYIELFGFLQDGHPSQHCMDGGIAYSVSDHTKIDVSGGFGITAGTALRNYIAIGFSFRLPVGKN